MHDDHDGHDHGEEVLSVTNEESKSPENSSFALSGGSYLVFVISTVIIAVIS